MIAQLALERATKRMYPDVLFKDKIVWVDCSPFSLMGCRSFLQGWKDENGVEVNSGRMNSGSGDQSICLVSPLESEVGDTISLGNFQWSAWTSRRCLVLIVERTSSYPANAPPFNKIVFDRRLGKEEKLKINSRIVVQLLLWLYWLVRGSDSLCTARNQLVDHWYYTGDMKHRVEEWSDQYGYHFSIYSTPSESLTDRFCRLDTEKFGSIPDITDKEYYTNSFHYDVRKNPTPFENYNMLSSITYVLHHSIRTITWLIFNTSLKLVRNI